MKKEKEASVSLILKCEAREVVLRVRKENQLFRVKEKVICFCGGSTLCFAYITN